MNTARITGGLRSVGRQLDRGWRLIGTGFSFAVFGIGGFLLGTLIIPATYLVVRDRRRRIKVARYLVSGAFAGFVELMRGVRVLDYRIDGLEQVGDLSRCVIVANHPSLIDVVFLLSIFRKADCVVKRAHWTNPFTMGPVRLSNYISNADISTLIGEAVDRLRRGSHLVMFPEGTRTVPGQPLDFHRGAATIAVTAQADCLPILIRCTPTTLTKAEPWYHIPKRRVLFEVKVLERIPADQFQAHGESDRHAVIELTERLRQVYSSRMGD